MMWWGWGANTLLPDLLWHAIRQKSFFPALLTSPYTLPARWNLLIKTAIEVPPRRITGQIASMEIKLPKKGKNNAVCFHFCALWLVIHAMAGNCRVPKRKSKPVPFCHMDIMLDMHYSHLHLNSTFAKKRLKRRETVKREYPLSSPWSRWQTRCLSAALMREDASKSGPRLVVAVAPLNNFNIHLFLFVYLALLKFEVEYYRHTWTGGPHCFSLTFLHENGDDYDWFWWF
jgi:hypothetical protein